MTINLAIAQIEAAYERRRRQGHTLIRDDAYGAGELARAAATYAMPETHRRASDDGAPDSWPWEPDEFHENVGASARQLELIDAAVLIVAEIERLRRVDYRETF